MYPTNTMKEIEQRMEGLGIENLQKLIAHANTIIENRQGQRKRELWGNVVAAINKYEKEIEDIEIVCRNCGDSGCFDSNCEDEPGFLFIN